MDEPTAEYAPGDLAPVAEARVALRLTAAGRTDIGRKRENNEDKYEIFQPETAALVAARGAAFVVCDGMGGHAAGQIAAEIGTRTFLEVYYGHPAAETETALTDAATAANRRVVENARMNPGRLGMGATLSALVLVQDAAYTVQMGDSRAVRVRDGALERLTAEHTWVAESLAAGTLTPGEAENHPYQHVITRALGAEDGCRPEVLRHDLMAGDVFLVVSDGVTNHASDADLLSACVHLGPAEAARWIVDVALDGGGLDNATAVAVRVDAMDPIA